ncbi:MAG: hypothetical protein P8I51_01530 [Polaribacter sp.]|jgi:hypothetical protein|nr:hypothetical protein [Polaribacter sp.]MDG1953558.1 hypothetical protein [Polaribacter sp.]MDG2073965.1 hypothetical protein [Polaribacter sp.]
MESKVFFNLVSRIFGFIIFIIGVLNILRGNDQLLGVAFMLISFIYVPNANKIIKKNLGFSIHYVAKIVLAIFLLWITLAVGAIAEGFYPEVIS